MKRSQSRQYLIRNILSRKECFRQKKTLETRENINPLHQKTNRLRKLLANTTQSDAIGHNACRELCSRLEKKRKL